MVLFQRLLNETIGIAKSAYNNGCKQIDGDDENENLSCVNEFLSEVHKNKNEVELQLLQSYNFEKIFDPITYSNEELVVKLFAPFKNGLERIISQTYRNCDFKVLKNLVPTKNGAELEKAPQSRGIISPLS